MMAARAAEAARTPEHSLRPTEECAVASREPGSKNDRVDARTLADLLRTGLLSPGYHRENGMVLSESRSALVLSFAAEGV
jgi:hypothetical protein